MTSGPVESRIVDDSNMVVGESYIIPEGYDQLTWTLQWIEKNMPELIGQIPQSRIDGWVAELDAGNKRNADDIRDDIVQWIIGPVLQSQYGVDEATVEQLVLGGNEGGMNLGDLELPSGTPADNPLVDDAVQPDMNVAESPGVLAGGVAMRIQRTDQEDIWVQAYEYPAGSGSYIYFRYDSYDQLKAAVGGTPQYQTQTEDWLRQNAEPGGNAAEVIGVTGTFNALVEDVQYEAARLAGISDPTILGTFLSDPEVQALMAQATIKDYTEAQTTAALRNTSFYKDTLYPGIENFYGRTDNPEAAYALYRQNVESNLVELGVSRDADGTYKSTIKDMLDAGVSDVSFATFTPTYIRAASNDTYRQGLNKWLQAAGMDQISDFDTFFDVIGGNAAPEINEVIELASLSYTANQAGSDLADAMLQEIAMNTDLSEQQMSQMFSNVDRSLIALGESGLKRYGIQQSDIVRAAAGYTVGDRTPEETKQLIQKIAQEEGLADEQGATYFTDYNREGAPIKAGLRSNLRQGA